MDQMLAWVTALFPFPVQDRAVMRFSLPFCGSRTVIPPQQRKITEIIAAVE
jgi:hypothetical protein